MGKSPKHRITNYFTAKEMDSQTSEGQLKEEFKEIFALEGKKIKIKSGKLTTPPMKIEKIEIGYEREFGKVFYFVTPDKKLPIKIPTSIEETPEKVILVYENRAFEDKEKLFTLSRSDKAMREDYKIELIKYDL